MVDVDAKIHEVAIPMPHAPTVTDERISERAFEVSRFRRGRDKPMTSHPRFAIASAGNK
jgi:hypothetical protein